MTIRWKQCLSVIAACALGSHVYSAEKAHRYFIKADRALTKLEVKACFSGDPPNRLYASSELAPRLLSRAQANYRIASTSNRAGKVMIIDQHSADGCLKYGLDLAEANRITRMPKVRHSSGVALLYTGAWLWLPRETTPTTEILLSFELPENLMVSAPWQMIARSSRHTLYRLGDTSYDWRGLIAIGRLETGLVKVPGSSLRLAVVDGVPSVNFDHVRNWIRRGALSVASLYGQFPIPSPQVLVVPIGPRSEPVPWGQVLRGGGPSVQLFIDQTRPLEEFISDWTLVHELSHMVLPLVNYNEPWLFEGIATYYQNILRARTGELGERQAWQKHHEGFERGKKGTLKGITLAEASKNMMRTHAFMRVYWSGTAIALLADVRLRQRDSSLDQALWHLRQCCLPSNRQWSALELMEKLDQLTHTKTFTMLYEKHVDSDEFPDLEKAYQQLGLVVENGHVHLDNDAELAQLRKDMTRKTLIAEGS